jgi:hypothetical protein
MWRGGGGGAPPPPATLGALDATNATLGRSSAGHAGAVKTYEPAGTKYVPGPDGTASAGAVTSAGRDAGTTTVAEDPGGTVTRSVSFPAVIDQSLTAPPYGVSYVDFADVRPPPGTGAIHSDA